MTPVLYPAIDLLAGRAVRLRKGERQSARVYSEDPPAQARAFVAQGARYLHVIDLDAAFGENRQTALIGRIAQAAFPVPIQVGGGIRDLRSAEETLGAGAVRIVFGTAAVERPALAGEAVARFGGTRVACGIDVKEGKAAVRGWTDAQGPAPARLAAMLAGQGVEWMVVTAIARDGTLEGFDLDLLREVSAAAPEAKIIASGGAGDLSHLRALVTAGIGRLAGAIAGTALYEGRFGVGEGQQALSC